MTYIEGLAPDDELTVNSVLYSIQMLQDRLDRLDKMTAYAKALEDQLEDYYPADLQPVVTRTEIIATVRANHGITAEMMEED